MTKAPFSSGANHTIPLFQEATLSSDKKFVHKFLKKMADFPLSPEWTERHWQHANQALVSFELSEGIRSPEEVFGNE